MSPNSGEMCSNHRRPCPLRRGRSQAGGGYRRGVRGQTAAQKDDTMLLYVAFLCGDLLVSDPAFATSWVGSAEGCADDIIRWPSSTDSILEHLRTS
ncbi:hypothetical protein FKM82_016031 [Ascaphus truei]